MNKGGVTELKVLAPAKVNLFLHIIGRREDGMHLLESLFAFADIGDVITVRKARNLSLKVTGPFQEICKIAGCDGEENLVFKAARLLSKFAPGKGAEITLEKNLPLSSGIGGGSSDAAATLKALQILWDVEIKEEDLFKQAMELGADVPACLMGVPCFVSGIGDQITPLDKFDPLDVVLVNPNKPVSTPLVFRTFKETGRPFTSPLGLTPEINQSQEKLLTGTHNDLQGPAIGILPLVGKILHAIEGCEGLKFARMSGSGGTCFGLFKSRENAEIAAAWLAREHPGWWVQLCRLTKASPFLVSRV